MTEPKLAHGEQTDWLQHQWVIAGVVASAARFVPIPFFDDAIRTQCRRFVVSRTLAASDTPLTTASLKPLYGESGGLVARSLRAMAKAPLKLLLFPVRKIALMATSIHGVPMEIMKTVLLGRTLRRQLSSGQIDPGRAEAMRSAFDEAFARMDFHALRAGISDSLRGVRSWKKSAITMARSLSKRSLAPGEAMPADDRIELTASRVQQVLDRPETTKLFAEFDRRFDQAYAGRLATPPK
jgi:hypothetical protein